MYDENKIIPYLADEFTYNSMWVTAPDLEKEEYIAYITKKLSVQKQTSYQFYGYIMYESNTGKPYLIILPKTPTGDFGCFGVKVDEKGHAMQLSLMSSGLFSLSYKDKESFEEFMKIAG